MHKLTVFFAVAFAMLVLASPASAARQEGS
jgi:hypothetical protein